jgi:hypothetical protein
MATISALYTYIEDYCKGASLETTLINRATIRILRDFCEQTKLVRETLTAINVVAETQSYTLTLPTTLWGATELVELEDVMFKANGAATTTYTRLFAVTRDEMRRYLDPTYIYQTSAATPTNYYLEPNNDVLSLIPTPSASSTSGLLVRAVTKGGFAATTYPDMILDKWRDGIVMGICAELMQMPGQRWFNPELSKLFIARYGEAIQDAIRKDQAGFSQRSFTALPAFTGGSRAGGGGVMSEDKFA